VDGPAGGEVDDGAVDCIGASVGGMLEGGVAARA